MTSRRDDGSRPPSWAATAMRLATLGAVAYFAASGTGALAGARLASMGGPGAAPLPSPRTAGKLGAGRREPPEAERRSGALICDRNVFDHGKRPCADPPEEDADDGADDEEGSGRLGPCETEARLAGTVAAARQVSSFALIESGGETRVAHPGDEVEGLGRVRHVGWRLVLVDPPEGRDCVLSLFTGFEIAAAPPADLDSRSGGIKGEYYRGASFDERVFDRTDSSLSFHWGGRSPDARIPPNQFSIRWTGYLRFEREGRHELCASVDNGVRITLDGRRIIDAWEETRPRQICEVVEGDRGWHPLEVEYYEGDGGARFRLLVGEAGAGPRPVEARNLCCRDG